MGTGVSQVAVAHYFRTMQLTTLLVSAHKLAALHPSHKVRIGQVGCIQVLCISLDRMLIVTKDCLDLIRTHLEASGDDTRALEVCAQYSLCLP